MSEDGDVIVINGTTFFFFPMKSATKKPIENNITLNTEETELVLKPVHLRKATEDYLRKAAEDYRKFVEGNDVIRD